MPVPGVVICIGGVGVQCDRNEWEDQMTVLGNAFAKAHDRNIARYHRLLRTRLSDVERNYIESRILEERAALQALATVDDPEPTAGT